MKHLEEIRNYPALLGNKIKTILLIGPHSRSSPLPTREMIDFAMRLGGKIIRMNSNEITWSNGYSMIYRSYTSELRGFHPDMIIIVNIYLFDIRRWWDILYKEIIPMVNKEFENIPVKYWRW